MLLIHQIYTQFFIHFYQITIIKLSNFVQIFFLRHYRFPNMIILNFLLIRIFFSKILRKIIIVFKICFVKELLRLCHLLKEVFSLNHSFVVFHVFNILSCDLFNKIQLFFLSLKSFFLLIHNSFFTHKPSLSKVFRILGYWSSQLKRVY